MRFIVRETKQQQSVSIKSQFNDSKKHVYGVNMKYFQDFHKTYRDMEIKNYQRAVWELLAHEEVSHGVTKRVLGGGKPAVLLVHLDAAADAKVAAPRSFFHVHVDELVDVRLRNLEQASEVAIEIVLDLIGEDNELAIALDERDGQTVQLQNPVRVGDEKAEVEARVVVGMVQRQRNLVRVDEKFGTAANDPLIQIWNDPVDHDVLGHDLDGAHPFWHLVAGCSGLGRWMKGRRSIRPDRRISEKRVGNRYQTSIINLLSCSRDLTADTWLNTNASNYFICREPDGANSKCQNYKSTFYNDVLKNEISL